MSIKLLTEHHLVFLSLKGGCTGSESAARYASVARNVTDCAMPLRKMGSFEHPRNIFGLIEKKWLRNNKNNL